jgi:flagellar hook-associated protein 2
MSSVLSTSGTSASSGSSGTASNGGTSSLANLGQGVVTNLGNSGTVSSTGLGSGVNINSIVQALVNAEGQPQQALLNSRQTKLQTQISAYGQLQAGIDGVQAALTELATPQQFQGTVATIGDKTLGSASTNSTATAGSYSLLVTQLANGSKLESAVLASGSTVVGTGTLSIRVGSSSFSVNIDSSNNTLAGIAAAISTAGSALGVSAALVHSNLGTSLVINSATTGTANGVTVSETDAGTGLASLVYDPASTTNGLTRVQAAQDAIVKLDGNAFNSASNVVTGLLTGVTLNLSGTSSGTTPTTLTIAGDTSSAQTAVQTLISSYNTLVQTIGALSGYSASTHSGGPLLGDALLNNLVRQVNGAIDATANVPAGSPFNSLAQIGIVANPDGTLAANSTKLNAAFANNFASVAQLFSGSGGIATRLNSVLTQFTQPDGVLAQQNSTLQKGLKDLANQTTALNQHLSTLQATLFAQYNAMDALVAQLKATGTAAAAQLSSIYYPGEAQTPIP